MISNSKRMAEEEEGEANGDTYIAVVTEEAERDNADTFQCGTCREAFHDLGLFLTHKNNCGAAAPPDWDIEVLVEEEEDGEVDGGEGHEEDEDPKEIVVPDSVLEAVCKKEKSISRRLAKRAAPAPQLMAAPSGPLKECHVCQRHFRRPSDLVVHLRSHSGEKPFQCGKQTVEVLFLFYRVVKHL